MSLGVTGDEVECMPVLDFWTCDVRWFFYWNYQRWCLVKESSVSRPRAKRQRGGSGLEARRTGVRRLCCGLYVHPLVAGLAFERTVIVIVGYRNRAVATVAGWWGGLGDRERVVREVLRVDGSGVVVSGETEVERDLDVCGELFLEQGEEIIVCNLGNGHWGLRGVPEGH